MRRWAWTDVKGWDSARSRVRVDQRVSAVRAVEVQLLSRDWERSAVWFVRLALKLVVQNDRDFVDVILLFRRSHTITQAVNSRHLIAMNRVQSKAGSSMYRGRQSCTGTGLSPRTELFLRQSSFPKYIQPSTT